MTTRLLSIVPALGLVLALQVPVAHAATIVVDQLEDGFSSGNGCSLREAVINAQTDSVDGSVECAAGSGADTILLPAGLLVMIVNDIDDTSTATGDLDLHGDITLVGRGANSTFITARLGGRVLDIAAGANIKLRDLSIHGGRLPQGDGAGARLAEDATLRLQRADFSSNLIQAGPGAARGGGIYAAPRSTLVVERSTLVGNSAQNGIGRGGGIYCDDCNLQVANSTLARNLAEGGGGALHIADGSNVSIEFSTITGNRDSAPFAIYNDGVLQLTASIVADNRVGTDATQQTDLACGPFAATVTGQESLVEFVDASCSVSGILHTRASFLSGYPATVLDDLLRPAASVQSLIAPVAPALVPLLVDALPPASYGCSSRVDQLGTVGPVGGACDFGAFERPLFLVDPTSAFINELGAGSSQVVQVLQSVTYGVDTVIDFTSSAGCTVSPSTLTIAAGDTAGSVTVSAVDDAVADAAPAFSHDCTVDANVVSGDPAVNGVDLPQVSITVFDDDSVIPVLGASPVAPGATIDFGVVGIGSGYDFPLELVERGRSDLDITSATIVGPDFRNFELGVQTFPFTIQDGVLNSRSFPVTCRPDGRRAYNATLRVSSNDPALPTAEWPMVCRGLYHLRVNAAAALEEQGASLEVLLDLGAPLNQDSLRVSVSVDEFPGAADAAIAGDDFEPVEVAVTFLRGEQSRVVSVPVLDDRRIEKVERVRVRVYDVGAGGVLFDDAGNEVSELELSGQIFDDDISASDLRVSVRDLPAELESGEVILPVFDVVNAGPRDVRGVSIKFALDGALVVREVAARARDADRVGSCVVTSDFREATCSVLSLRDGESVRLYARMVAAAVPGSDVADGALGRLDVDVSSRQSDSWPGNNRLSAEVSVAEDSPGGGGGSVWGALPVLGLLLLRRRIRKA